MWMNGLVALTSAASAAFRRASSGPSDDDPPPPAAPPPRPPPPSVLGGPPTLEDDGAIAPGGTGARCGWPGGGADPRTRPGCAKASPSDLPHILPMFSPRFSLDGQTGKLVVKRGV